MLRLGTIILVLLTVLGCKDDKLTQSSYSNKLDSFVIDKNLNYNQVLKQALELDEAAFGKVRGILASYRKNLKSKPERAEVLKKNREKKLSRFLSPIQMQKRKYVNAVYYNTVPKYPTHPANVKKKYKLTDGQTLKLIEIEGLFAADKDVATRKKRLEALLGATNMAMYLKGKAIII